MRLPIYEAEEAFQKALTRSRRIIIEAPTGSGKSTQAPQMALASLPPGQQIVVLQPRRIAARMLAHRVARERGGSLGDEVGYQVRFERVAGPATRIRYVTEGVLLRELVSHPQLPSVGIVFFDEFHERHLFGDVMLALLLDVQQSRPDLTLVVMSATLDGALLDDYLAPCERIAAQGRMFEVERLYLPRPVDFRKQSPAEVAAEVVAKNLDKSPGHVLVFMPGAYEIGRTIRALQGRPEVKGCEILPLHGELTSQQQDQAVSPSECRRIIVATNVAETSITIEGVTLVVDSGLARMARYDSRRGMDSLFIENISQASADQRAGRAGRTAPGLCFRLWTLQEHQQRPLQQEPEIRRHDLAEIVLSLKAMGIENCASLKWLEPPSPESARAATVFLRDLGALDADERITDEGRRMLAFPLHPRHARMLLVAGEMGCVREICLLTAIMQGRNVFVRSRDRDQLQNLAESLGVAGAESDLILAGAAVSAMSAGNFDRDACEQMGLHAGTARQALALARQFERIAERGGLPVNEIPADHVQVRKCLMTGFIDRLSRRTDGGTLRCLMTHGRSGELTRASLVRNAELIVPGEVAEIESGRREVQVLLSQVTAIEEAWLRERFSSDCHEVSETFWDAQARRARRRRRRTFRDLTLEERCDDQADPEVACRLLAAEVRAGRIMLTRWNEEVEQWIARVRLLARWRPDFALPDLNEQAVQTVLEDLCHGAFSARDLKDVPVMPAIKAWLSLPQQLLVEQYMPVRITLPSGRRAPVHYDLEKAPTMSATIQDLFDLKESPRVGGGNVPVRIEILAPNRRPVQVTDDLASFWAHQYPAIRQELRRKYHKHEWR